MTSFRDELLEDLLKNSGSFIDITYLLKKYCGTDNTFYYEDTSVTDCRLSINLILSEFNEMGWILFNPVWGFSTSHRLNQETNKRYITLDTPVKARLTTKGDYEVNKIKADKKETNSNTINIQGNLTGAASIINQKLSFKDLTNPIIQTTNPTIAATNSKKSKIEIWYWVAGIIIMLIAVFELLKKYHYIK